MLERQQSGDEMVAFLDAIATNHTYFFREEQHFAFLRDRIVPGRCEAKPGRPHLDMWCAACSTGEEPYTLAITLADSLKSGADGFSMLASDLSTKALATARGAVYKMDRVQGRAARHPAPPLRARHGSAGRAGARLAGPAQTRSSSPSSTSSRSATWAGGST